MRACPEGVGRRFGAGFFLTRGVPFRPSHRFPGGVEACRQFWPRRPDLPKEDHGIDVGILVIGEEGELPRPRSLDKYVGVYVARAREMLAVVTKRAGPRKIVSEPGTTREQDGSAPPCLEGNFMPTKTARTRLARYGYAVAAVARGRGRSPGAGTDHRR